MAQPSESAQVTKRSTKGSGLTIQEMDDNLDTVVAVANHIGATQHWFGVEADIPSGWVALNGQSLDRTTYARLFNVLGTRYGSTDSSNFLVPDVRGLFLRGWDDGTGTDPEAGTRTAADGAGGFEPTGVGSTQGEATNMLAHTHYTVRNTGETTNGAFLQTDTQVTNHRGRIGNDREYSLEAAPSSPTANTGLSSGPSDTGVETRPVNIAVIMIMRAL